MMKSDINGMSLSQIGLMTNLGVYGVSYLSWNVNLRSKSRFTQTVALRWLRL